MIDPMDCVTEWLKGTATVADLVTWGGRTHIYQGAPAGAPVPAIILYDIGSNRNASSDVMEELQSVQFTVKCKDKNQGKAICATLVVAIDEFTRLGKVVTSAGVISTAEMLSRMFRFDPVSNKPEYLVDARFVVT